MIVTPQGISKVKHDPALRTTILTSAIVSVSYYLTAILGFEFALQPGSVSTLWMPNSILFAGLLLTPRRWWWIVILAVFPAHIASELYSGVPTAMVLSWFVSNVAQAWFAAYAICLLVKDRLRFDRFRDLTIFILFGAFLAPFLSSFLDAALVKLNGWGNNSYWYIWRVRFFSNVIATLTLVPVVILWASGGIAALRKASALRYLEGALLFLGLLAVGIVVFDIQQDLADRSSSLVYLPLPFLLWATVRFGPRGASMSLLLLMFLAILGATRGAGPFVTSSSANNALSIQLFLIVVSIPLMALAAVIEERRRADEENQAILRAIPDMMFLLDNEGVYLDYYTRNAAMLLVPPQGFLGKSVREVLPAEIADKTMEFISRLNGSDQPQMFEYDLAVDGESRHYEARLVAAGADKSLSIVRDVTEARRAVEVARRSQEQLLQGTRQIRALAARLLTAQESERRRISLLLHDDVSQNIAALGLAISSLKRKLPATSDEIVAQLDQLGTQAHDLTTQIRKLSHQLHPEVLEHLGLVAALESHVTEFGHKESIEMKFVADVGSDPLPFDLSVCLYRVTLEALSNISRHSGARSASVSLKEEDDHLMLEVSDDGNGFDVEKARRGTGIGLLSTEERIKLFQGTLDIRSDTHNGTVLVARVPLVRSS